MSFMVFYMFNSNILLLLLFLNFVFLNNLYNFSIIMIFMTFLLMKMIFFSVKEKMNLFFFPMKISMMKMMFLLMILFFMSTKILSMYLYFELISLLIFMLIYFSSFSSMRLKASIYLLIFMGLGTFPMFLMIFYLNENFFLFVFSLSFLIKIPILLFHLWLPKAHVEANYYDSMILASLLLKLGGYGIILLDLNFKFNFLFIWSIMGTTMISILVLFLLDVKMIMAFSSIIHMNMMIMMLLSNSFLIEKAFVNLMISHAISSSIMFFMVGMVYEQSLSRSMLINKNFFLNFMLFFMVMFFVLLSNMGTPPFLTFFSEMYVYLYMLNYSLNYIIFLMIMLFMSCMFNLILIKNMSMMVMNKFFKIFNLKINSLLIMKEHLFYLIYFI